MTAASHQLTAIRTGGTYLMPPPDPRDDDALFYAQCSCGWSDSQDSGTSQLALDRAGLVHFD